MRARLPAGRPLRWEPQDDLGLARSEAFWAAEFDDRQWLVGFPGCAADAEQLHALVTRGDLALLGGTDSGEHAGFEDVLLAAHLQCCFAAEGRVDLFFVVGDRGVDVVGLPDA